MSWEWANRNLNSITCITRYTSSYNCCSSTMISWWTKTIKCSMTFLSKSKLIICKNNNLVPICFGWSTCRILIYKSKLICASETICEERTWACNTGNMAFITILRTSICIHIISIGTWTKSPTKNSVGLACSTGITLSIWVA